MSNYLEDLLAEIDSLKDGHYEKVRDLLKQHQEDARLWQIERHRYKQALEKIVSLDYRGHPSPEQRIAYEALKKRG